MPLVLSKAHLATQAHQNDERERAFGLYALTYHAAATMFTKLGEVDLSWIASDRGLVAAEQSGSPVVLGSLLRSVAHSLLSTGRYLEAISFTNNAAERLRGEPRDANPTMLSVYGTLFLAGAMAAARANDRSTTRDYLSEAGTTAAQLGRDENHMWTAFGPTNVDIHRVSTAMELGDVQIAIDLGPRVDTQAMPVERRVRHALEVSRAYSTSNRRDEAIATLLDAEQTAPEQVRYHYLSRHLVQTWIRTTRIKPSHQLTALAHRLEVV